MGAILAHGLHIIHKLYLIKMKNFGALWPYTSTPPPAREAPGMAGQTMNITGTKGEYEVLCIISRILI